MTATGQYGSDEASAYGEPRTVCALRLCVKYPGGSFGKLSYRCLSAVA